MSSPSARRSASGSFARSITDFSSAKRSSRVDVLAAHHRDRLCTAVLVDAEDCAVGLDHDLGVHPMDRCDLPDVGAQADALGAVRNPLLGQSPQEVGDGCLDCIGLDKDCSFVESASGVPR